MIYRDWDRVQSRTSYKRRWQKAVGALAGAQHENHIRDECLTLAIETLELYTEGSTDGVPAQGALADIEVRLAELEPEEEVDDNRNIFHDECTDRINPAPE